jgi:nicotinamidase/pyrazinamidase
MAIVFVDIDTQHDFIDVNGALSVPGADKLSKIYARLYALAKTKGIPVIATMDCHIDNDPEFEEFRFPVHCVRGTSGWNKIEETKCLDTITMSRDGGSLDRLPEQLIIEKVSFSVFTNEYAERILLSDVPRLLNVAFDDIDFVVFGVATDYCVKAAAIGLAERGGRVSVIEDAIAAVQTETGKEAIDEMKKAGVRFVLLEQVEAKL